MKRAAVLVAGGKGLRMGSDIPKQFLLLQGKPVLMHTLLSFINAGIENLVLVLPESHFEYWHELVKDHDFQVKHALVAGGDSRFFSVFNGLKYLENSGIETVAVQDGVRPLLSTQLIERCFEGAEENGNAVPVIRIKDSIRKVELLSNRAVNRASYFLVQTPQTFRYPILLDAYKQATDDNFTDDASVVESAGYSINLVEGEEQNIKITTPFDLKLAALFLEDRK
ncbi:MAG: 2-C-methyl-D-erythritol 4-phosphate cytidylyltransferase [Bacteroidia bacterium]|nr:2-C-methyl-D-erythritol 4-phosphate cytidylyltransferase [Bacteroidia bacterium]